MAKDKYKAVWLSHSSIADFLKCPRLYYLRNVYKDPKNNHKITVMSPPLALGQAVHEVIEHISTLPVEKRLEISPVKYLDKSWEKITGKKGGFKNHEEETEYKDRAIAMLKRIEENPGPLLKKAIKLKTDDGLPYYWFSEEDNIILCGKIDWIEYLEDSDSIHIIDFKTGKGEESEDSLQLPIYHLLASNLQKRPIGKVSYWHIDKSNHPIEVKLPDLKESYEKVYSVAKRIKLGRQINYFKCPENGCFACKNLERVLKGEGEKVAVSEYGQDIYVLPEK
jgi:ATP-dependent helicase/DNAse subunit B